MKLRNGILTVGGTGYQTWLISNDNKVHKHMMDALEGILSVARATHRKLWSEAEVREALLEEYWELSQQGNLFCRLLRDLSLWADELAPYWSLHLEGLTHDLVIEDDPPPWYVGDEEAAERPGTDEVREKISDLLITPRQAVPFASISRHILENQEEGCWVEQNPRLLGAYADSFDRCLIIGLPAQKYSEFAWFNNGYGGLDEDELEVLVEFLALMMSISRHWGPLTVGKMDDEIDQMAMIAWRDLAARWHESPVGVLVEHYLRGGPVYKAASQAARIPHRI
jgi:hypothetical protein